MLPDFNITTDGWLLVMLQADELAPLSTFTTAGLQVKVHPAENPDNRAAGLVWVWVALYV